MKHSVCQLHLNVVKKPVVNQPQPTFFDLATAELIRQDSIKAGGSDPMSIRFRVVEYERGTGQMVRVLLEDSGFLEALENTTALLAVSDASHFCLEPVGFVQ